MTPIVHEPILVDPRTLRPHPRNYQQHPDDQIEHLAASIREHGFFKNVVVARDLTILAGHGATLAAIAAGLDEITAAKMPYGPDDSAALKLLAADNEIQHLSVRDDRALSDLLRELVDVEPDAAYLMGTGYDRMMLANLAFVTRAEGEIDRESDAAQWVGLPEYEDGDPPVKLVISCETEAQRDEILKRLGITVIGRRERKTWGVTWPAKHAKDDLASLRVEAS